MSAAVAIDDLREQIAKQHDTVAHLAKALADVSSQYAELLRAGCIDQLFDQAGPRSAAHMEILGDILNGMDACDPSDEAFNPVFEEAQRLWPDALKNEGWSS